MFAKTAATKKEVALIYHTMRVVYFLAVAFAATIFYSASAIIGRTFSTTHMPMTIVPQLQKCLAAVVGLHT